MKKIILLSVLNFVAICCTWCQTPVTSLSENFDVHCVTDGPIPYSSGWSIYTSTTATIPYGEWTCTDTNGRRNLSGDPTPGIQCTDTSGNAFHLDTSFLITPELNLTGYSGNIYLQFDTKTSNIYLPGYLTVERITDPTNPDSVGTSTVIGLTPVIGIGDSSGWVTHVADLTPFKSSYFYVAFRYTSTDTTGSMWFLDNVNTTTTPITLRVASPDKDKVQLSILGLSTTDEVNFSYTAATAGTYRLALFDMVGREVYDEQLNVQSGSSNHQISGLDLHPGMYLLKMGNDHSFGITKVMVQ